MPSRNKAARGLALAGVALLAACATDRPTRGGRAVSDTPVKIGAPYRAGGRTWVPADDRGYDAVGYASWYGGAHAGRPTANGERFDPRGISAAHPTLPLPSYVEVTVLDSGRTILTRVNDRGPFVASRIIDLSAGAAKALGIERQGVARVRVRRVQPPEADRAALRAGRAARARPDADRERPARLSVRSGGTLPDARPSPARTGVAAGFGGAALAASSSTLSGVTAGVPSGAVALPLSSVGLTARSDTTAGVARDPVDVPAAATMTKAGATSSRASDTGPATSRSSMTGMNPIREANRHATAGVPDALTTGPRASASPPFPSSPAAPFYIHVAALDDADRADGLAGALAAIGPAAATAAGPRWQVRLGPYGDAASARSALARARRAGYQEARIVRESAQ